MNWRVCRLLLVAFVLSGCGSGPTTPDGNPVPSGFQLIGDPASPSGATWTYIATTDGVAYDLRGILFKPGGQGPFPAVLLSHGGEQNALAMIPAATEMVTWGLVGIATNYTHATDNGVLNELWIYPGGGHVGFVQNPAFYTRLRAWYARFGLFQG